MLLLCVVTPCLGVFSRRGILVTAPIGIVLILLSAGISGEFSRALREIGDMLVTPGGLAALLFVLWAFMALAWSPAPGQSIERLLRVTATGLIAAIACFALPERARATNLYLLPIGTALTAVLTVAAVVSGNLPSAAADTDQPTLERALASASVGAFAGLSWLSTRNRNIMAMSLAALMLAAAIVMSVLPALIAMAAGAVVLGGSAYRPADTARVLGWIAAALVLGAPVFAVLVGETASGLKAVNPETVKPYVVWSRTILDDPLRMIAGRGLDTVLRHRLSGQLDIAAPSGILFLIWYELGVLGAAGLALTLAAAIRGSGRLGFLIAPFALGAIAAAFTYAVLGVGVFQTWWLTTLSIAAIAFAAVRTGLYRTTRPQAKLFQEQQ